MPWSCFEVVVVIVMGYFAIVVDTTIIAINLSMKNKESLPPHCRKEAALVSEG